jgi:hypothetical protein
MHVDAAPAPGGENDAVSAQKLHKIMHVDADPALQHCVKLTVIQQIKMYLNARLLCYIK